MTSTRSLGTEPLSSEDEPEDEPDEPLRHVIEINDLPDKDEGTNNCEDNLAESCGDAEMKARLGHI